jgi:AcrR family transcriptional regulator
MAEEQNSSERILEAALQVFSQKGYDAASTREICEQAGITKPTLYYFYGSKEGVYRALVDAAFEEYRAMVEEAMARPGTLRDRFRKMAEMMFERAHARPQMVRFLFSAVYSFNSPIVLHVQKLHEGVVARIAEVVTAAADAGEIRRDDMTVRMTVLFGALVEAVSNFMISGNPKLTRKLAHSIIDTIFEGWEPSR